MGSAYQRYRMRLSEFLPLPRALNPEQKQKYQRVLCTVLSLRGKLFNNEGQ